MNLSVKPRGFLASCILILVLLNLANAASVYLRFIKGADFGFGIIPLFDFDTEGNFPTLFNGALLGFSSLLAMTIGLRSRSEGLPHAKSWLGAAAILAFLCFDELCGIHDALFIILQARMETEGGFSWPWVIPYAALTIGVAVAYVRFFLSLPTAYKIRFALAAMLYVGGAIGMEMVAAAHWDKVGGADSTFGIFYTIEENLEFAGCILAGFTLLKWIEERLGTTRIGLQLG